MIASGVLLNMLEPDSLSLVTKRADFIVELADRPLEKRELVTALDCSRATVNRAVGALEDAGLVRDTEAGYEPTLAATLAVAVYRDFLAAGSDVLDATDLLASLEHDADVAPELLCGADRFPVAASGTFANFERVRESLDDADDVDVVVPSTRALPVLDHWQNALVAAENATVVLEESLYDDVRRDYQLLPWLAAQGVEVLSGDANPFVLVRAAGNGSETVFVLVYDDEPGGFGALRNDSPEAVDWARGIVESSRAGATAVGTDLETHQDRHPGSRAGGLSRKSLPQVIEAEGFTTLDDAYFENHDPRDLGTALRTGLSLADVEAGHAIERTAGEAATSERLTDELLSQLDAGADCAVVGQPGAGKSTVCKAVACEWADRDRGHVLYRESGKGKPFESLASFRAYLRETRDDVLVVVEDGVRPEANAVLEVAAEFEGTDDVTFLVDARASDWNETRLLPVDATVRAYKNSELSVTTLSPPDHTECKRLLERYEDETGTTLDVTAEELLDRIDDAASVSGGMFLLAHYICLRADPVSSVEDVTPTPLVEDVQERIASLQREASDVAMGAALLTQLLNVAEVPLHEEFLQAQTVAVEDLTTDAVLSALADRQIVVDDRHGGSGGRGGNGGSGGNDGHGGLQTPHNQWSRVFLTEALEVLVDAPERLGNALANVFDLTNAETRSALDVRTRNSAVLKRIAADPTAWADDLAEKLFEANEDLLELAPYYGTFENPTFDLETACSDATVFECGYSRGQRLSEAGDLEAAAAAFQTVVDAIEAHDDPERFEVQRADCVLGLGSVRGRQGDLDEYEALTRRALELHRENGNDHGEASCYIGLGHVAKRRGEYEQSKAHHRRAASIFDDLADLKRKARSLGNVAVAANAVDDHDTAAEYARRSTAIRREIGDEYGLAQSHTLLGQVAEVRGRYETATDRYRLALVAADSVGSDEWRVIALTNMGNVAVQRGELDEAVDYFSRASEYNRECGDPKYEAIIGENLAEVYRRRGDLEASHDHATTGLEKARTASDDRIEATVRTRLGQLAFDRGDHETAREELEAALDSFDGLGVDGWRLTARIHLARVELDTGALDEAAAHASAAHDLLDVEGELASTVRLQCVRGEIRAERGELEAARECFDEAASLVDDVADTYVQAVVYRNLGEYALARGDDETAGEHLETSRALAERIGAGGIEYQHELDR